MPAIPEVRGSPEVSLTYVAAGDQGPNGPVLAGPVVGKSGNRDESQPVGPALLTANRSLEAASSRWPCCSGPPTIPIPKTSWPALFSSESFLDITGYASDEFDRLAGLAAAELDQESRVGLWSQAHQVMIADAPIAPLMFVERYYLK